MGHSLPVAGRCALTSVAWAKSAGVACIVVVLVLCLGGAGGGTGGGGGSTNA